jgi:thymidylate kinase
MSRYIVLEGPDGAGKTSLHKTLKRRLSVPDHKDQFVFVREPYFRDSISMLKTTRHPLARMGIFLQDRVRLMNDIIIPAYTDGKTIVSDRSYISCEVYQFLQIKAYYGKLNPDFDTDTKIYQFLQSMRPFEFPKVSFIILLTAPVDETVARLERRDNEVLPNRDYIKELRSTYIDYVADQKGCGYTMLDSSAYSKAELLEEAIDILLPPISKP